jgi:hypothetical protein
MDARPARGRRCNGLLVAAAGVPLVACAPAPDTAHLPIVLPSPYAALPAAPPGFRIEPGRPVNLDANQRKAVVAGVVKWMKNPPSVQFGKLEAAQNSRRFITVCGLVNGSNTTGTLVGFQPFLGTLMGPGANADFVLVGIGSGDRERAEVTSLCRASGIYGIQ